MILSTDIWQAMAAMLLGAGAGWLARAVMKAAMLFLLGLVILLILLRASDVVNVQVNAQQLHGLLSPLVGLVQRLRLQNHLFFIGGAILGFKYGILGWLKH